MLLFISYCPRNSFKWKRSLFSSILNVDYSLCGILCSIAFYFVQDWRIVFYILIAASFLTLIFIWDFIYDSPRGYINNKNYEETIEILEGISSFNVKLDEFRESIKQDEYQEIISVIKGEEFIKDNKNNENKNENENINDNNKLEDLKENIKENELEINEVNESKLPDITISLIEEKLNLQNKENKNDENEKEVKN